MENPQFSNGILSFAGTPTAAVNAVQTLTIGGTPTAGTFTIGLSRIGASGSAVTVTTAAITWSATNATLLANINTALDALSNGGAGYIVATAGTLTAGIGTILLTAASGFAGQPITLMVATSSLTGSSPTAAITNTTTGVYGYGHGADALKGRLCIDTTNGKLYINTGTQAVPVWTVVGSQS